MIFLDTGAFLARYLRNDQCHQKALKGWKLLRKRGHRCFTSNFVLDETFTLLARKANSAFAVDRARSLLSSRALTVLRPTLEDELEAVEAFSKYADPKVSFTDCISFVLMKRNRIQKAFSFDRHFSLAGFQRFL